jgi:triacylglycerol esterase/lipase EstA (alpha/beta hydrolase family)
MRRSLVACALVAASLMTTAGAAQAAVDPIPPPPGANDWSCRPAAAHPRPVVLVHGTFENRANNWGALSPLLKAAGSCVYALDYGQRPPGSPLAGTAHVAASAGELAAFVDRVRAASGAAKVDIVGHSQGGMMPRYYLKRLGGAAAVHALVGLTPSNHGTTASGIATLAGQIPGGLAAFAAGCPACTDQFTGSAFLRDLNAGGDTVPGVTYTVITTRYDEVVTPYTSAFLRGPRVTNIVVQDQCPSDRSEHLAISYDPVALRDVLNALDPAHAVRAGCELDSRSRGSSSASTMPAIPLQATSPG